MRILSFELFEQTPIEKNRSSCTFLMKKQFGEGKVKKIAIKEGIWYCSYDFVYNEDICILTDEEDLHDKVWMYFCLTGSAYFTFRKKCFHIKTGHSSVFSGGYDICIKEEVKKNNRCKMVGVLFDENTFISVTGRKTREIHQLSSREMRGKHRQMPLSMRRVAEQLALEDYTEVDRKIFLEAKVLEFVAYKLGQLDNFSEDKKKSEPDEMSFIERLHYAAELMEQLMLDPPGIFDLSREVGMDHTKLIRGFKDVFGYTPFEYLSKIRLHKAAKLISSKEQNVTEAAFSVGYSNLSHFAKVFRSEFGMNPKEYSKFGTSYKSENQQLSIMGTN